MAKGTFPVFGVLGGLWGFNNITNPNSYNILLSSTVLNSFWKLQIPQKKINYINKKSILASPSNPPAEALRNDTSIFQLQTTQHDAPTPRNTHENNYFRSNTTQAFSPPGTPIYLKYLLSTFQPSTFLPTISMVKELKLIEPNIPPAATNKLEEDRQKNKTADTSFVEEITKEEQEVAIEQPAPYKIPPAQNEQEEKPNHSEEPAPSNEQAVEHLDNASTSINIPGQSEEQDIQEDKIEKEPDAALGEVQQANQQINNPTEEISDSTTENEPAPEIRTEIELNGNEDNPLEEVTANNNEQLKKVITELSPENIDRIIQETKRQELVVLGDLKTLYTALNNELKNPPQAQNDSHSTKRELIVKNIDNILKDIEKSTTNIEFGISINRHKALITENSFNTKPKLEKINAQRQARAEKLKELQKTHDSQDEIILNYSEAELGKIEKFVIASGKDLKQIANTRNDDIRRKFFSSFIDHTISFAKYNVNWAPAAYNLAWAVAEYVVMGIVVDTITQGVNSIGKGYKIGTQISNSIKNIPDQKDGKPTANLFVRSIATLSGLIGGAAAMTIMTPIMVTFTGTKDILYTPVGIYKNYQSYKKDKTGATKNWAKSESQLKLERTIEKNEAHKTKEQKKFVETVQKQSPVSPKAR